MQCCGIMLGDRSNKRCQRKHHLLAVKSCVNRPAACMVASVPMARLLRHAWLPMGSKTLQKLLTLVFCDAWGAVVSIKSSTSRCRMSCSELRMNPLAPQRPLGFMTSKDEVGLRNKGTAGHQIQSLHVRLCLDTSFLDSFERSPFLRISSAQASICAAEFC